MSTMTDAPSAPPTPPTDDPTLLDDRFLVFRGHGAHPNTWVLRDLDEGYDYPFNSRAGASAGRYLRKKSTHLLGSLASTSRYGEPGVPA